MNIPIRCEKCGEIIATFDTRHDTSCGWAEAPCGEKVCEDCCNTCECENMNGIYYSHCPYKEESGR